MANFYIRKRTALNNGHYDHFGGGTEPVGRKHAALYETKARAQAEVPIAADLLGVGAEELQVLRAQTSGEHHAGQPSFKGRKGSRWPTTGENKTGDLLDHYIREVQPFIDSGQFDREEGYKLDIAAQLSLARQAVVDGGEWSSLVRKGLVNNLTGGNWRARDVVTDWFTNEPDSARPALQALWTDGDVPISERIRAFLAQVPDSGNLRGSGTRLRVVAVLLMALGHDYPPYKRTEFDEAYRATNRPQPPTDADEGALYEHALAFLDDILERTRALGFERPANRLEAQSVVWVQSWMGDESAPPSDPALWQIRAGTNAERAPEFLALERIDIGFEWHNDIGAVNSREEFNRLLAAEGRAEDAAIHPRSAGTQLWQFAHEMSVGDLVLVPLPDQEVHIGEITGAYRFDEKPSGHSHLMDVRWLAQSVPFRRIGEAVTDSFVRWTVQKLDDPNAMERVQAFLEEPTGTSPPNLDDLEQELLLEPMGFLRDIERLLGEKKQVIFQGPPGTGKTYIARRLARELAGAHERLRLVQFHPSYAYEDFVQGFRPTLEDGVAGFTLRHGPLVQMAEQAADNPGARHFLVIDEINRGNLAKVFGELYFLLEYRDHRMHLQYSDPDTAAEFSLPENLYIIGTMNTADRSIALVDLALRRRFSFVEFDPSTEPVKGLLGRWLDAKAPDMGWVADVVDRANEKLDDHEAAIGPSYFMKDYLDEERVERIWKHDVLPYVEEQLYGQPDRLKDFDLKALRHKPEGSTADSDGESGPDDAD
ncbi:MAG: AAA family ATPase [Chloroflexota bacterium]|nr:AAA family ATPase [Chloroflexota bacterium]